MGVTGRSSGSVRGSGRTAGREEDDGDELGENRESGRRAGRTETKEKNGGRNGDKLGEEQGARDTSGRRTEAGERAGTTETGGEFPGREPGQPGEIWVLPGFVPGFPVRWFKPVVDVPALWTTVVVLGGALLLRLRQSAIVEAAETRASALEHLRTAKAKELGNEASLGEVRRAVRTYRAALDEEERLRTLLPGIRLRAPNNPQKSELDRQGGVAR